MLVEPLLRYRALQPVHGDQLVDAVARDGAVAE